MSWTLDKGSHKQPEQGVCLMEAVAWVAGEEHSDHPACACPILAAYGRALNDYLPHAERQRLAVFVPRLVGSKGSRELERQRAYRLTDAAVRVFAPDALDARGEHDWAERLRALDPVVDKESATASAASASASAAYAASAATAAAYAAAYAATAAATAAAYAAYAAAAAAYAASAATAAASAAHPIWDTAIALFDELCPAPAEALARTPAEYAELVV